MNAAIPAGDVGTLASIDFDGLQSRKITFVDNYLLQDSVINLDDYVSRKIAARNRFSFRRAILSRYRNSGQTTYWNFTGVPVENEVTVAAGDHLAEFVKPIGLIDTGLEAVGEITRLCVVHILRIFIRI